MGERLTRNEEIVSSILTGGSIIFCDRGGTGKRVALRMLWVKALGSSTLLGRTILNIKRKFLKDEHKRKDPII